jgi:signal transduction histidine kinase
MRTSGSMEPAVEVRAVETFADLLFAFDSDEPASGFYGRLCEAVCRIGDMDRVAIFLYDEGLRRVRAVGTYGIALDYFRDANVTVDDAPMAMRALSEDRVIEVAGDFRGELPSEYLHLLEDVRLVCVPMAAAGRWSGVIMSDRPVDKPLGDPERHLLWTLGKVAALAAGARLATRSHETARQLEDRIDLAREIHDGVIQRLFGVSMALSVEGELPEAERHRCAGEIQDALADLRTAVQRPLGRRSRDTGTTLLAEVKRLADAYPELNIELAPGSEEAGVPPRLESLAQSVLGEALRNAKKHAQPTRVGVSMARDNGTFVLEVTNDGLGGQEQRGRSTGIGLRLAAFEALQHGGTIEFGESDAGHWRVRLLAPVSEGRR